MEYFDVLDENGIKTGGVLPRDDVHKQGLWHRSVIGVVVNEENKVLMQQRSATKKKYPGLWDLSVAGHIRSGEDPVTAIFSAEMSNFEIADFCHLSEINIPMRNLDKQSMKEDFMNFLSSSVKVKC